MIENKINKNKKGGQVAVTILGDMRVTEYKDMLNLS